MIRVPWDLEEAVALLDLYERYGGTGTVPRSELENLSLLFQNRAQALGIITDGKYRNLSGLQLQLACMHYVATDGQHGMSSASQLFYQTYDLYKNDPDKFRQIRDEFYRRYQ